MNKKKKLKQSTANAILSFNNLMNRLEFKPVSLETVTRRIVEGKMVKPNRATIENVLQTQYEYKSRHGYTVVVLTGTKDGTFNTKGSAWIHIVDKFDKKDLTREFYKKDLKGLLKRLAIYAQLAKNLADFKPRSMYINEKKEASILWTHTSGKYSRPLDLKDYVFNMSREDESFLLTNESNRNSYLRRSKKVVKRRQRQIQTKWK